MTEKKIRILLVDDHVVLRMGLIMATLGEADLDVVAEAENGDEAIKAYRQHSPDVVILDLKMPQSSGLKTLERLQQEFGAVRVLIFSNYAGSEEISQAFEAGASGFVMKEMPLTILLEGIRKVYNGERFIPQEINKRISQRFLSQLSHREFEVLSLVAKGMSNKAIAAQLHLVEGTVKIHLSNIFTKLHVTDRTQAILAAERRGIIEIE